MTNGLLELSQEICQKENIEAKKKFGQNFLIDEKYYSKIIEASDLSKQDVVLEVGPGLGFLTEKLAKIVKKVIAVELDPVLFSFLKKDFEEKGIKNVEFVNKDILQLDKQAKYNKIVANLPYNISAHFIYQYLSQRKIPDLMVLMLQREVVERICATTGKMSILAVSVQYFSQASLVEKVPKEAFWPIPKVNSAIIKIVNNNKKRYSKTDEERFFKLVKTGFALRRKMLRNNLVNSYKFKQKEVEIRLLNVGLNSKVRAQDLSVDDWKNLLGEF